MKNRTNQLWALMVASISIFYFAIILSTDGKTEIQKIGLCIISISCALSFILLGILINKGNVEEAFDVKALEE